MQGVRTTRGCVRCRRYKKGCDLQKPTCGRCQQSGLTCQYEDRQFIFVTEAAGSSSRVAGASGQSHRNAASLITAGSAGSLAKTDRELQTDSVFWTFYLSEEDPALDGSIGGVLSAPWITTVRSLAEGDNFLRTALRALEFSGLGWMRDDRSLVQHGLRLYAQALRETNKVLQDREQAQSDTALACCRVLSLFEMFRRNSPEPVAAQSQVLDWQSHIDGTCRLIQLRGPEKHTAGYGLSLFDSIRITSIIYGIARRQPNALTDLPSSWPRRGTLKDDLYDLMSMVPNLYKQIDTLSASIEPYRNEEDSSAILQQAVALLQHCISLGSRLRAWESRAVSLCTPDRSMLTVTSEVSGGELKLLDLCNSHGDGFFFLCTQYWAVSLKLYSTSRQFYNQILSDLETITSEVVVSDLPNWVDPEPYAHHIAHVTPHFFRRGAGLWSAQCAVFPVGAALFYLAQSGRRDSALFNTMTDAFSRNKTGAIMRDFVQNIVDSK